jgi:hypothetical protein
VFEPRFEPSDSRIKIYSVLYSEGNVRASAIGVVVVVVGC